MTPKQKILLGSMVGGIINAVINGTINWFQLNDGESILLTKDSITSTQHTVIGSSVGLAVSLAFILTTIAFFTTKNPNKPAYFPKVLTLSIKHSIYAFGLIIISGVLIQNYVGSIEVSRFVSATVTGIIALIVAVVVDYETKCRLLLP
ncbi:MAG: hypothetical protein MUE96_04965 [Bacteroidia bacterium]|jgi:hypothetical protein|nr:hypothetical protein [Bacteroidia bacterium]